MSKKHRTVIGILCIVCAVALGALYWFAVANASEPVVRAREEIPAGTKITVSMLETVRMGRRNLPGNITGNAKQIVGAYANTDIQAQDIITGAKLLGHQPAAALKDGRMLYSLTMKNLADSLSGQLVNGDIVRVVVPTQANTGNNAVAASTGTDLTALQYVEVAAVTASNGQSAKSGASGTSSGSNQPATVTLVVSQKQLDVLASLGQQEIQLALVSHGNAKEAETLLSQQDALLTTGGN